MCVCVDNAVTVGFITGVSGNIFYPSSSSLKSSASLSH